jgi:hypothetical protein
MFHFLEGMYQKGPNSVCSFLHYVLHEIQYSHPLIDNLTELILFSDATCSQNRCWTVLKFCLFIAIKLNIKIVHKFPVRGHSFCICDANFSLLGRKLKKIETVELPKEYIDMLKMQKFDVLQEKVFNYENFLSPYFKRSDKLKISKAVKIEYFPDGSINMCEEYENNNSDPINLLNDKIDVIKNLTISDDYICEKVDISEKKINDVLSLLEYVKPENRDFYKQYLNNNFASNFCNDGYDYDSEEDY